MSANQQKPKSRYSVLFDPAQRHLNSGLVLSLGFLVSYSRANVSLAREKLAAKRVSQQTVYTRARRCRACV